MTPDQIRAALADLGGMASKTSRADAELRRQAHTAREAVQRQLEDLRSQSDGDAAADRYEALTLERGRLDRMTAFDLGQQ